MGRVALAALALAALALAGCGERGEPVEDASVSYPITVGGKTFAEPPTGVATPEGSSMADLVGALGRPAGDTAGVFLAWASDRGGATAEQAGRGYVAQDASLEDVVRSIAEIGLILGATEEARGIVELIEADRERVRAAVRGRPPVPVFVDLGFYATAGDRTLIGDLLGEAGGENVAGATPEPGPFPIQLLADRDPDVYVISSVSRTRPEDLRRNPRTRNISAVREDRIVLVPHQALAAGPRIGEGLLELARALHPDAFD